MAHFHSNNIGKEVRMHRILNPASGKTVIIPLDHGVILGPMEGIVDPRQTVENVIEGGVDSVLFNASMARWIYPAYRGRCGAIFNLTNIITSENDLTLINSVEYAIRHAADGVSVQVIIGSPHERYMLDNFRIINEKCSEWNMPLLAMMYPTDALLDKMGMEAHLLAARAGAELGADIVKTSYTGDRESFSRLVECCPAPVVVAGGPKSGTSLDTLSMVRNAMDCGAAGVALGRNVWQQNDMTAMTKALVQVVHENAQVSDLVYPQNHSSLKSKS
jgi:fructose-bisphosphate aldolase/2-amino-3,7-dideoxy-D-threo-hept-6-ulosonate synthase